MREPRGEETDEEVDHRLGISNEIGKIWTKRYLITSDAAHDIVDRLDYLAFSLKNPYTRSSIHDIIQSLKNSLFLQKEDAEENQKQSGEGRTLRYEKTKINLYRIVFSHSAPRDTEYGIKGFFLAHNEEEVYDYIDKEFNNRIWRDNEEDHVLSPIDNSKHHETFRGKIIRLKGNINDEERDFSDAYYGISFYGWELIAEDVIPEDFSKSIELEIIKLIGGMKDEP